MKIFTRIALIIAGIFTIIGTVCLLIAFSMGLTKETFMQMVNDGKFQISLGEDNDIRIFGLVDGVEFKFFDDDDYVYSTEVEEESSIEVEENYTKLDLEYGAGQLDIYYDDVEYIQVHQKNVVGFRSYGKDDTLYISGGIGINDNDDASLTIILPEGYVFEEVDMEIGAAKAEVENLTGNDMQIVVGAGYANLMNLNAKELELEVGAGLVNVIDVLVDNMNIEAGVGEVSIRINGAEKDYNYNIECGIGSVHVGENSYGGLGAEQNITNPGAKGVIDIECGIGEVVVAFIEEL